MGFDLIWIALGIAVAGYFIGEGLRNFNNPNTKGLRELFDDDDEHELIQQNDIHHFMGISKEDAKYLIQEHPEIPHIIINDKVYYPKAKLRNWLKSLGE